MIDRKTIIKIVKQHVPLWGPMQAELPVDEIADKIADDLEHEQRFNG